MLTAVAYMEKWLVPAGKRAIPETLPGIEALGRWLDFNISGDARRLRNRVAEFAERF
jgi:hypothetical protein